MMNMTGGGGYILHAIHVFDDPKASSILAGMKERKRQRRMRNSALQTGEGGTDIDKDLQMAYEIDDPGIV